MGEARRIKDPAIRAEKRRRWDQARGILPPDSPNAQPPLIVPADKASLIAAIAALRLARRFR